MKKSDTFLNQNTHSLLDKSNNNINKNISNNIIFFKTIENTLKGISTQAKPPDINLNKSMIKPQKSPSYRKSMWSEVEDQLLLAAVQKYGTHNWGIVAASVSGRTRKQCRERWAGKLNPELAKDPWTIEEDNKLIELHNKLGNKWALIAVHLPGRSPIMLKNRWGYILRHSNQLKKDDGNQIQAESLTMNDQNPQNIQQNDNPEILSNDQNKHLQESNTIIPPFYPPNIRKDNSDALPQTLPFSLHDQPTDSSPKKSS